MEIFFCFLFDCGSPLPRAHFGEARNGNVSNEVFAALILGHLLLGEP
jgi:hypothetical protein